MITRKRTTLEAINGSDNVKCPLRQSDEVQEAFSAYYKNIVEIESMDVRATNMTRLFNERKISLNNTEHGPGQSSYTLKTFAAKDDKRIEEDTPQHIAERTRRLSSTVNEGAKKLQTEAAVTGSNFNPGETNFGNNSAVGMPFYSKSRGVSGVGMIYKSQHALRRLS